jgi:hypothetical protein
MDLTSYQRIVFGYHGCDSRVADAVLAGKTKLVASENAYDWLGSGIYFWEHGPARAYEWAVQQSRRKRSNIRRPAVIGAIIQLGTCFDLLDVRFTRQLSEAAAGLEKRLAALGTRLPENQSVSTGDYDWLKRHRDCFVLNATVPAIAHQYGITYQTVRGVFQEGEPAFNGAGIKLKSHIQVAVRDPNAIIGYFRPQSL